MRNDRCSVTLVAWALATLTLVTVGACTNAKSKTPVGPVINHIQLGDGQAAGVAAVVEARITAASGLASAVVYYQAPQAATWTSVVLTLDPHRPDTYAGEIPAAAVVPPSLSYYLEAADKQGQETLLPTDAPTNVFTFTITTQGGDTDGPLIAHVPIQDGRPMDVEQVLVASVSDATGVASVVCHYRAQNATAWIDLPLVAGTSSSYSATMPAAAIQPPAVEYWLEAVDTAPAANHSTLPKDAPATVFTFTVSAGDTTPPVITLTPVADGQPDGRSVPVIAHINDDTGVHSATLYYRVTGAATFDQVAMAQADPTSSTSPWTGVIPAASVTTAGVDYYVEATDSAPLANVAREPSDAPTHWHSFTVVVEVCQTLPFGPEGFEGGAAPAWWGLYARSSSGTLDPDCHWSFPSGTSHGGNYSAVQYYVPTNCETWLVLPCIDLTNAPAAGAVIDFWETFDSSGTTTHSIVGAAGSADPTTTVFTKIVDLPYDSSGSWLHKSVLIPPTAGLLGQAKVYLAFHYNSTDGDNWHLDDIGVRAAGPSFDFVQVAATPGTVLPGTADVALDVTVKNTGDGAAAALTGTLSTTDSKITVTTATAAFAAAAVGAQVTSATPFHLSVDAAHATAPAPLTLTLTDGTNTYVVSFTLQIGLSGSAHIVITTGNGTYESDYDLYVGTGDPTSPTWLSPIVNSSPAYSAGTFTYDVDLLAQIARLPPSKASPWFVKVVHHYDGLCRVDEFTIKYGAAPFSAPGVPAIIPAADFSTTPTTPGIGYVLLPPPSKLELATAVTTPTPVRPGDSVSLAVSVRNAGADTDGAVSGTLAPKDADTSGAISNLAPTPAAVFSSGALAFGVTAPGAAPWTFDVKASHNNGKPLEFVLTLTDAPSGATWTVPVVVPVPWPGVEVIGWASSATANGNHLPDPGEDAILTFTVQNTGSGATAGPVTGTLTVDPATTAAATVTAGEDQDSFGVGPIAQGAVVSCNTGYRIHVDAAATPGQAILLDLVLTDGTNTWPQTVSIPIYGLVGNDPQGDNNSNSVDLKAAYWGIDATTIAMRVDGWSSFDASSAHVSIIVADTLGNAYRLEYDS